MTKLKKARSSQRIKGNSVKKKKKDYFIIQGMFLLLNRIKLIEKSRYFRKEEKKTFCPILKMRMIKFP
jgi:hypothetical protein